MSDATGPYQRGAKFSCCLTIEVAATYCLLQSIGPIEKLNGFFGLASLKQYVCRPSDNFERASFRGRSPSMGFV